MPLPHTLEVPREFKNVHDHTDVLLGALVAGYIPDEGVYPRNPQPDGAGGLIYTMRPLRGGAPVGPVTLAAPWPVPLHAIHTSIEFQAVLRLAGRPGQWGGTPDHIGEWEWIYHAPPVIDGNGMVIARLTLLLDFRKGKLRSGWPRVA